MKRNSSILVLLLLILVLILYIVLEQPGETSRSVEERDRLLTIDSSAINRLTVSSPDQIVVLARKGSEWFLDQPVQYRADQSIVTTLLGQLVDLRSKSVVSSNREKHGLFQVDTSGNQIILSGPEREEAVLVVGKAGLTSDETYVRISNADEVHLVNTNLASIAGRSVADWRDRTIVQVPREEIREITYQYGDTVFVVAFADSLWRIGDATVEPWIVNNLLYSVSHLRADGFVDEPNAKNPPIVGATTYSGITLWFMRAKGEESYTVRASTTPQRFTISQYQGDQILKRKKDFLKRQ